MMRDGDTIVALSSGAVPSGVAVVRLSGPLAGAIVAEMTGNLPVPRVLKLARIVIDGEPLDTGLVVWMPGPRSFTGEDCAELHLHGSPAVVQEVLRRLAARAGVRLAEAGEFTRRAFENGKLDLVEAQGLGDLIAAETENQRALAYGRLEGGLTRRLENWRERLLDLRAEIEARLDFSDEGDVGELPTAFGEQVAELRAEIGAVLATRRQGRILRSGFRVVLGGPPNVGKSSLLNALARSDVAIVTDEAGTTRDIKEVPLDLDGQLVILVDSAGLRQTSSKAEALGVDRALEAMRSADLLVWLLAPDQPQADPPILERLEGARVLRVGAKSDIGVVAGVDRSVSSASGAGIEELLATIRAASGASSVLAGEILVSHEQDWVALQRADGELECVPLSLRRPELAAEHLRRAGAALERLLGRMDAEAVLDRLFGAFCIGK